MDSRDLLIIAAVGFGAWWLFFRSSSAQPAADGNPAGAASMNAGAAAQTQLGSASLRGLISSGLSSGLTLGSKQQAFASTFQDSARRLLALNVTPQPVTTPPFVRSSPTLGLQPTGGSQPPPQRLNTLINPASGLRGVQ